MTREEIYSRFEELDKKASLGGGVDKIEKQLVQAEGSSLLQLIALYKALGGGWRE